MFVNAPTKQGKFKLRIFCPDAYEAEQLLKEVDIHSVTGVLKLYLRELPEALFTDALYPELLKAWGSTQVRIHDLL